jgi:two-component system, sensor histidine kinase and response regulator
MIAHVICWLMADRRVRLEVVSALLEVQQVRPRDPAASSVSYDGGEKVLSKLGKSGRVLLAEDNVVSQRVASAMLERLGFRVHVVEDGAEAVRVATLLPFEAILMDCQIPVLDGAQATAEIRRREGTERRTPIIGVTASPGSDRLRCLDSGMDDYLPKPLRLEALAAVLDRWVQGGPLPITITGSMAPVGDANTALHLVSDSSPPVLDPLVLDRLEGLGRVAGEDLVAQLVSLFLADAGTRMTEIRLALATSDWASALRASHALSGASANLGAKELARLCDALATASVAGDIPCTSGLLAQIERELGQVRDALISLRPAS